MGATKGVGGSQRKVVVMDLLSHRMKTVEGATDFYGKPLDEVGEVTPQDLLEVLHPGDLEDYAAIVERCELLKPGETISYRVRAKHADGRWMVAACVAEAIAWDGRGFAVLVRAEVEMTPILDTVAVL